MSVVTKEIQDQVSQLYIAFFGRAPEALGFAHWTQGLASGFYTPNTLAEQFGKSPEFESNYGGLTPTQQVERLYMNVLDRAGDPAGVAYWAAKVEAGLPFSEVAWEIVNTAFTGGPGVGEWDQALVANKVAVGVYFAATLASNDGALAKTAFNGVTDDPATVTAAEARLAQSSETSFTLTTGVDTASAQVFTGLVNGAAGNTFTPLDNLSGQKSDMSLNTLRLIDQGPAALATAAISPAGASLSGIGNLDIVGAGDVGTLSTAGALFAGVTNVTLGNAGTLVGYTASATQNVTATNTAQAANAVVYQGGNNLTITNTGVTTGTTTIGNTTAAAGDVILNVSNSTAATTTGAISITGGKTVTVTSSAGNAVNTTVTQSAVTVAGNASTTAVTVNQDATATASATVVGKTAGAVTITDVNSGSATAAGVINTVTLNNFGAATVNSGALSTLNLSGTATSAAVTLGALTTPSVTAFGLNLNGLTATGAVTVPTATTLNIDSSTKASTMGSLVAANAKSVNVAGDAKLTVSANTLTALTDVTVTNTAGFALGGAAINTGATFTGGAGNDAVVIATTTKAINMGAGDDKVTTTTGLVGTGGSVDAGEGFDTISMTGALAATASADAVFNSKFKNFNQLEVTAAGANTINLVGINGVNSVLTGAAGGALVLNGFNTNGTLTLNADVGAGAYTANVANAAFNPSDVFNIKLDKTGVLVAGSVTVADVETINISAPDAAAAGSAAAINTLTLVATSATSVNVSGNNGLTLTNAGNIKITNFDASGVVGNGTADTAANLAVTFVSANDTATATVTITGGAGDDVLTGGAAKDVIFGGAGNDLISGGAGNDTIDGGAGNDTIIGGAGADVLTGGAGNDVFLYAAVADSAASVAANTSVTFDTITDFTSAADKLNINAINTALTGAGAATAVTVTALTTAAGSIANTSIGTFADLAAAVTASGKLVASAAAGNINAYVIDLAGNTGALGTGKYLLLNNNDTALTANDVMIAWTGTSQAPVVTDFVI